MFTMCAKLDKYIAWSDLHMLDIARKWLASIVFFFHGTGLYKIAGDKHSILFTQLNWSVISTESLPHKKINVLKNENSKYANIQIYIWDETTKLSICWTILHKLKVIWNSLGNSKYPNRFPCDLFLRLTISKIEEKTRKECFRGKNL